MARRAQDFSGMTFGRWTVLRIANAEAPPKIRFRDWIARCVCGTERSVQVSALVSGRSESCGCLQRERTAAKFRKHGHKTKQLRSGTKEYRAWRDAKYRCERPSHPWYSDYGGRGITMCERWRNSFEAFLADMGTAPAGTSLDRIDNSRGYEPGNCRWADAITQSSNTRRVEWIEYTGRRFTIRGLARELGVSASAIRRRLRQGQTVDEALAAIRAA